MRLIPLYKNLLFVYNLFYDKVSLKKIVKYMLQKLWKHDIILAKVNDVRLFRGNFYLMDDSFGLILWIVVCIVCSAFFSATETAFSSCNRIRLKNLANDGNKRAELALSMSETYDKLLSSILIGNNVVNIAASSLATILFLKISQTHGAMLSTVVMTVLVLIFGEISPKSLAKENPESFAMFSAPILKVIMTVLAPFNWVFGL